MLRREVVVVYVDPTNENLRKSQATACGEMTPPGSRASTALSFLEVPGSPVRRRLGGVAVEGFRCRGLGFKV